LLTLKGRECLERADLILYDGLVNPLLLRFSSAHAERTCRSPGPSGRVLNQAEINQQLVTAARSGQTVVRLKGGDPFIFGRGSEEAAALAEAGIPFEVVPGITAATAACEYVGISLTRRGLASEVAFITGHEDPAKGDSTVDYDNLAAFPGTLVFYMGLHRLKTIVDSLLTAGKDPDTPACVISRGTLPDQRTVLAPLRDLPEQVRESGLRPPSLIIVGECVLQRETIDWFERLPLFGKRIGITRPAGQAESAILQALELGAQPIPIPTIRILPPEDWSALDAMLARLDEFDWLIFTSANGVNGLLNRLWSIGGDVRKLSSLRLAAIGPATAEVLAEFHLRADVVPDEYRAEALADALKPHVSGQHVLWAQANRGRDVLPDRLRQAGAMLEQVVVYRNLDVESFPEPETQMLEEGKIDWIGLSSPSIARGLKKLLTPTAMAQITQGHIRLAAISPVTSAAAGEVGLPIAAEATSYTWKGIFEAIIAAEQA